MIKCLGKKSIEIRRLESKCLLNWFKFKIRQTSSKIIYAEQFRFFYCRKIERARVPTESINKTDKHMLSSIEFCFFDKMYSFIIHNLLTFSYAKLSKIFNNKTVKFWRWIETNVLFCFGCDNKHNINYNLFSFAHLYCSRWRINSLSRINDDHFVLRCSSLEHHCVYKNISNIRSIFPWFELFFQNFVTELPTSLIICLISEAFSTTLYIHAYIVVNLGKLNFSSNKNLPQSICIPHTAIHKTKFKQFKYWKREWSFVSYGFSGHSLLFFFVDSLFSFPSLRITPFVY